MVIKSVNNTVQNIETANFIMLSLYREYAKFVMQGKNVDISKKRMRQINSDLLYLDKPQLIMKVRDVYAPLLHRFIKK